MSAFLKKYARYLILVGVSFLILLVLFTWRQLFLPFIVGIALAYMFFPLVKWIERHLPGKKDKAPNARRIISIILAIIVALVVLGAIIYFIASAIASSSSDLIVNASHFIDTAITRIQEWISSIGAELPEMWQESLDDITASLGTIVDNVIQGLFAGGGVAITSTFGVIFSFAALPLFLFYLLKDAEKIKVNIFGSLPPNIAQHTWHIFGIIERTLGRYIRAQLILGMIVSIMTFVGLIFIAPPGVAVTLSLINGFFEMIPTIGPIIGGSIMAVVILAVAPDKVLWAIVIAVLVQLLENNLLVPRVQAATLRLHPAVVLFLLVAGSYLWGFWGLVFAVPITSTLVDVVKYVHNMGHKTPTAPSDVPETGPSG